MAGSVFEQIRDIVVEQLDVEADQVTPDARFVEDLGADSLALVEMIMRIEDELDVEIPDDDVEQISTVGDAVEYVEQHQS